MILSIDGGTSCLTGYFLSQKDLESMLPAFKSYHTESEYCMGQKLQTVRIDTGHEWLNSEWFAYCDTNGIHMNVNGVGGNRRLTSSNLLAVLLLQRFLRS